MPASVLPVAGACLMACGPIDQGATRCGQIVGGTPDDGHSGVAALVDGNRELVCTGTIVGSSDGRSVILTAAHCLNGAIERVIAANDYRAPSAMSVAVSETRAHPGFDWDTGELDVGLLMTEGMVPAAHAIAIADPNWDNLGSGAAIEFVGYGEIDAGTANSRRQRVAGVISAVTPRTIAYHQADGGPCVGDSGGPALVSSGGIEIVVGITSHGDGAGCRSTGTSARVSAAYDFIRSAIRDQDFGCAP